MLHKYINGNYFVFIDDQDGTKIRVQPDKNKGFDAEFPESIDINIGRRCDGGCRFCYEGATPDGPEADLDDVPFLDSLRPYTETAINGNSVSHPQLIPFLEKLKKRKVFANLTVNQIHFERKYDVITSLLDKGLVKGLGVSLQEITPSFLSKANEIPNLVVHTITGVHGADTYRSLYDKDLKVLILGYKNKGRGVDFYELYKSSILRNQMWLKDHIQEVMEHMKVCAFDNLAIEQLRMQEVLDEETWRRFYMGDDGQYTFYIDLVDGTFGKSSLAPKSEMMPLRDDVAEMLQIIKEKYK